MTVGSHSYDVVVVGSSNLDLVATVERLPGPGETVLGSEYAEHAGGKGLNQAVAAARAGADTAFITCLGPDHAGDTLHSLMVAEGVASFVTDVDVPTGRALISVDGNAENSIVVVPGANQRLGIGVVDAHRDVVSRSRVVLCQLEIPLDAVEASLAIGRAGGAKTVLNPAPARTLTRSLLQLVDVITPNQHELGLLGGASTLLASGVSIVIVTLGARGMRIVTRDGEIDVPPFVVRAVDTTGAGDAACGALAAAISQGVDIGSAARRAAAAGALAATRKGAVPSLPNREEIDLLAGS
ncbi:MAG: ribokinase [Actinobacteria bacterium]|nr:ribokinase [Actinomycetota bacterium]